VLAPEDEVEDEDELEVLPPCFGLITTKYTTSTTTTATRRTAATIAMIVRFLLRFLGGDGGGAYLVASEVRGESEVRSGVEDMRK